MLFQLGFSAIFLKRSMFILRLCTCEADATKEDALQIINVSRTTLKNMNKYYYNATQLCFDNEEKWLIFRKSKCPECPKGNHLGLVFIFVWNQK